MEAFQFVPPIKPEKSWDTTAHEIAATLIVKKDRKRAAQLVHDSEMEVLKLNREARARKQEFEEKYGMWEGDIKALDSFEEWMRKGSFHLERPERSRWPALSRAYENSNLIRLQGEEADYDAFFKRLAIPQVFLIEHDWGSAFAGAKDFDEGEFPLPYEECVFDFQFSGCHVLLLICDGQGLFGYDVGKKWIIGRIGPFERPPDDRDEFYTLYHSIYRNIRALCIALDAEVVESKLIRAPSNGSALTGVPLSGYAYHVVSLSHRSRVDALPAGEGSKSKKRLHFRRGHWRHFSTHRTWIRWMLVGDPDLGFIDKEYRA